MVVDYTIYTKAELVAMLQARDANTTDIEVIKLKIEKLTKEKLELARRSNEVLKIGALSSEEQNALSAALQDKAAKIQDKIAELITLQAKLTTP